MWYVNERTGKRQYTVPGSRHHQRLSKLKEWQPEQAPLPPFSNDEREHEGTGVEMVGVEVPVGEESSLINLDEADIDGMLKAQLVDVAASLGIANPDKLRKDDLHAAVKAALRGA